MTEIVVKPFYVDELIILHNVDATASIELADVVEHGADTLVVDPPWDDPELLDWAGDFAFGRFSTVLVFTDGRRFAQPIDVFGPPDWVFTWDTRNTWSVSETAPVQQTKHCLLYSNDYSRDATLWGDPPEAKDHPTTRTTPLDGRRLTDLWSESIRWLHNPTAGRPSGGQGADRHKATNQHAKPLGWIRCLIGNTTPPRGLVVDPFAGTGTTLRAAKDLGLQAFGCEIDADRCAGIVDRLGQEVLAL